ncbi:unnamed protein product [Arctia plantaginis]|uniref:Uncharacterized protein n=1 Tax=Arctia plantaginis TaxID=874455 RepID=A0A8S1BLE6_ARCPL|nr:unnamed protein product [Arctia plantaginis]
MVLTPKKRPFCNVFNGCSGSPKRSQASIGMSPEQLVAETRYLNDETFGSALDSEVVLEELFRKILTEAQMWDAIREATAEATRRNLKKY